MLQSVINHFITSIVSFIIRIIFYDLVHFTRFNYQLQVIKELTFSMPLLYILSLFLVVCLCLTPTIASSVKFLFRRLLLEKRMSTEKFFSVTEGRTVA